VLHFNKKQSITTWDYDGLAADKGCAVCETQCSAMRMYRHLLQMQQIDQQHKFPFKMVPVTLETFYTKTQVTSFKFI
jgi:hypothetical protein